jgi:hypothetical protein
MEALAAQAIRDGDDFRPDRLSQHHVVSRGVDNHRRLRPGTEMPQRSRQLIKDLLPDKRAPFTATRENGEMDDWAQTDLAWEPAEVACLLIPDRDRIEMYIAIGAGYSYSAIDALLETVTGASVPVSPALVARLAEWLATYTQHEGAARLREILAALRSVG